MTYISTVAKDINKKCPGSSVIGICNSFLSEKHFESVCFFGIYRIDLNNGQELGLLLTCFLA